MIPIAIYSHFSAIRSRLKGLGPASALGSELLQPTTFIVKLLLYVFVHCTTSSLNYSLVLSSTYFRANFDKINKYCCRNQKAFWLSCRFRCGLRPSSSTFPAQPAIIYLSQQPAAPSCQATEAHRYEVSLS